MSLTDSGAQSGACIDAVTLKQWLHDASEIALLDVREHGQYGEGHLFLAASVPYSRLEADIKRLVPRLTTRIVIYDDDDGVAERAHAVLAGLGFTQVHRLRDGVAGWRAAGFKVFAGVNVPSKTFGELAELALHTPRINAQELARKMSQGEDVVVLDGRPYAEFQKMSIPGAICCPNGELALRATTLVPDSNTTIVINCAGRTRSIIGAQTLINLGVPNPVLALENGTQGWFLNDLTLDHEAMPRYPDAVSPDALPVLRARAEALAHRTNVAWVSASVVQHWLRDENRSTYVCDVRTPEEFDAGTLGGAQHTPGGQLVQATDQYVAVKGARLVLLDDEGIRAPVVASWLKQLGWDVSVLAEGLQADLHVPTIATSLPAVPTIASSELASACLAGAQLIDIRPSMQFRHAHLQGARWSIRPRFSSLKLTGTQHVVLLADDPVVASCAARELAQAGVSNVHVNVDGPAGWEQAGLSLLRDSALLPDDECIDYLFFVHDRHAGNKAAARQYLAWETDLIHQIDSHERSLFTILPSPLPTRIEQAEDS